MTRIRYVASIRDLLPAFLAAALLFGGCEGGDRPNDQQDSRPPGLVRCEPGNGSKLPHRENRLLVDAGTSCAKATKLLQVGPSLTQSKPRSPVYANDRPVVKGRWSCMGRRPPEAVGLPVTCRSDEGGFVRFLVF